MSETKPHLRINRDKKDVETYRNLQGKNSPFAGASNSEMFMYALVTGFDAGLRVPLKTTDGLLHEHYLKPNELSIIKSIAINEEDSLDVLLDMKKVFHIAEEYANGGIIILNTGVFDGEYGSYLKKTELDLIRKYDAVKQMSYQVDSLDDFEFMKTSAIIADGESGLVEFKSSMIYDYRNEKYDKNIISPIIAKTLSCFMNSRGGYLLIGLDDDKKILGIEIDYERLVKKNRDGFGLYLTNLTNKYLGMISRQFYELKFEVVDGHDLAIIGVQKADRPVYFALRGKKEFYVRQGNSCNPLNVEDSTNYIRDNWAT